MTTNRRLGLGLGAGLGVIGLGLVLVFTVLLPHATGNDAVDLPDSLPGGWIAADVATAPSGTVQDGDAGAEAYRRSQREAVDYVRRTYAEVYDAPVAFRAYTDKDLSTFVVVTVFSADGGAFGPSNGVADPKALGLVRATTELTRVGQVVCVANYQPVATGSTPEPGADTPLGVSCQLPGDGRTVQVATTKMSVDDTVRLVHEVDDAV